MNKLKLCSKSKILPAFINGDGDCYHRSCHDLYILVAIDSKLYATPYTNDELDLHYIVHHEDIVAHINRDDKIIVVSTFNKYVTNHISKYLDGYKVYVSMDKLPRLNYIDNLIDYTIRWFIHNIYTTQYYTEFEVLSGKRQVYYGNRDKFNDPIDTDNPLNNTNYLRAFRKWLEVNQLTNNKWFNHQPFTYFIIAGKRVEVKHVGGIYKFGIFSKDEEETLRKRYFYSLQLRGRKPAISYEQMDKDWSVLFVVTRNFMGNADDVTKVIVNIDDFNSKIAPISVRANYIRYLLITIKQSKDKTIERIRNVCKKNPKEVFRNKNAYIDNVAYQYFNFYINNVTNAIDSEIVKCYVEFNSALEDKENVLLALGLNGDIHTNNNQIIKQFTGKHLYDCFIKAKANKLIDCAVEINGSTYDFRVTGINTDNVKLHIGCNTISEETINDFIDYYKLNWRK